MCFRKRAHALAAKNATSCNNQNGSINKNDCGLNSIMCVFSKAINELRKVVDA